MIFAKTGAAEFCLLPIDCQFLLERVNAGNRNFKCASHPWGSVKFLGFFLIFILNKHKEADNNFLSKFLSSSLSSYGINSMMLKVKFPLVYNIASDLSVIYSANTDVAPGLPGVPRSGAQDVGAARGRSCGLVAVRGPRRWTRRLMCCRNTGHPRFQRPRSGWGPGPVLRRGQPFPLAPPLCRAS